MLPVVVMEMRVTWSENSKFECFFLCITTGFQMYFINRRSKMVYARALEKNILATDGKYFDGFLLAVCLKVGAKGTGRKGGPTMTSPSHPENIIRRSRTHRIASSSLSHHTRYPTFRPHNNTLVHLDESSAYSTQGVSF